jgi:hypothetical protein
MKKPLIMFIPLLIGCYSFKPVSTMDNFHLYQEYLDVQYELSEKEQEYNNLYSSYLSLDPSYRSPVKRYNVTGERSDTGSYGYTQYELAPVYDYGSSNAPALHNIEDGADRKKAEKDIKKLRSKITEIELELSRRGLMP